MKRNLIRLIAVAVILVVPLSLGFAKGSRESVDFSSLDLSTASSEEIIKGFENLTQQYSEKKQDLTEKLEKAYKKNDATKYFEYRQQLKDLHAPVISKAESSKIEENLKNTNDADLALWLYKTSPYYRPQIKFCYESDGQKFYRTYSTIPGQDVTVPSVNASSKWVFKGWKAEGSEELIEAESTIQMPCTDTVYYAVFELAEGYSEGKSLVIEENKCTISASKQQFVTLTFSNMGTENIKGLELELTTDDPCLYILSNKLSVRNFVSNSRLNVSFGVLTKAEPGTVFTAVIKATDQDGNSWTKDVAITVE